MKEGSSKAVDVTEDGRHEVRQGIKILGESTTELSKTKWSRRGKTGYEVTTCFPA